MFDTMRKHSQSFIIYVLFAAIIAVFVISFGPAGGGCNTDVPFAARVNGDTIGEDDFKRAYSEQIRGITQNNPGIDPKMLAQLGIKKQVLDQLIEARLMLQSADKAGLAVSDKELYDFITKAPAFQVKGVFDPAAYEKYVNYAVGTSPARFEGQLKEQLLASKYRDSVEAAAAISDAELWQQFQDDNDKVDVAFVEFKDGDAAVPAPTAAEVDAFLKDHDKEVSARYAKDSAKYHEPKKWKASHILIKVPQTAGPADVKKAQDKIDSIAVEAKTKDFAELAKKYSEDSSKDKGGDLGYFSSGMMVKAFQDATEKLKVGEVSAPVRSPFGFHIIKLVDVKEGSSRELPQVNKEIATQLITEERQKAANQKRADAFLAEAKAKGFTTVAVGENEKVEVKKGKKPDTRPTFKSTGLFGRGVSAAPKIGIAEGLVKDAFTLGGDKKLLDKTYRAGDRLVVVALKERETAEKKKFDEEHVQLRTAALNKKKSEIVHAFVQARRAVSRITINERLLGDDVSQSAELD